MFRPQSVIHLVKLCRISNIYFCSVVSNSATPWSAACQASRSITNSRSLLKLISMELVMPSNHLILCRPLLLLPSIFPSIRVFKNESALRMRWPNYWNFSFSISPSNEYSGLISFRIFYYYALNRTELHFFQIFIQNANNIDMVVLCFFINLNKLVQNSKMKLKKLHPLA